MGKNILMYMHHCKPFLTACFLCLRLLEVNIQISLSVKFKVNSFMFLIAQLQLHFYLGFGKLRLSFNICILRALLMCAILKQYSCVFHCSIYGQSWYHKRRDCLTVLFLLLLFIIVPNYTCLNDQTSQLS